jgi:hypothetical protein
MKICSVGADLFPAVEQTEMAKLIVVFLNYANAPKNDYFLIQNYVVGLYKGPRLFSLS